MDLTKQLTEADLDIIYRILIQEAGAPDRVTRLDNFKAMYKGGHMSIPFDGPLLGRFGVLRIDEKSIWVPYANSRREMNSAQERAAYRASVKLSAWKEHNFPRRPSHLAVSSLAET